MVMGGTKLAVHHVDVDDGGARGEHLLDLRPSRAKSAARMEGATPRERLGHQIGWSIELLAVVAAVQRGAGHAHDRRVLPAVRAHRARARSGAGSSRSGSGRAGCVGRSQGSEQPGQTSPEVDRLGRRSRRLPAAQAGDEEALGAVAVGKRLERAWHARMLPQRQRRRAGPRPRSPGCSARNAAITLLVLAGRDRAGGVDERAARAQRRRAGRARIAACSRGQARGLRRAPCASARRGARRACRGPSTAGRRARGRSAPGSWASAASAVRTLTFAAAPMRAAVRRERRGAARVALDRDHLAAALHQRGEVGRLGAGRGAQVEHALAGPRVEQRGRPPWRRATGA